MQPNGAFMLWVLESCARSGVPLHVRDPDVLHQVAVLLGAPPAEPRNRQRTLKPVRPAARAAATT